jgi:hypothetical protein
MPHARFDVAGKYEKTLYIFSGIVMLREVWKQKKVLESFSLDPEIVPVVVGEAMKV